MTNASVSYAAHVLTGLEGDVDSDVVREDIIRAFKEHGVVILRDVATSREAYIALTETLAPGRARGVVPLDRGLALHGELYFLPSPPDVLWFHCARQAMEGGFSLFCDGVQLVRAMSSQAREYFETHPIVYDRILPPKTWQSIFRTQVPSEAEDRLAEMPDFKGFFVGDDLHTTFTTWALRPTQWARAPAFINSLLVALEAPGRPDYPEYGLHEIPPKPIRDEIARLVDEWTFSFRLEPGDIAMIDNTRVMHGRTAFQGPRDILAVNGFAQFD